MILSNKLTHFMHKFSIRQDIFFDAIYYQWYVKCLKSSWSWKTLLVEIIHCLIWMNNFNHHTNSILIWYVKIKKSNWSNGMNVIFILILGFIHYFFIWCTLVGKQVNIMVSSLFGSIYFVSIFSRYVFYLFQILIFSSVFKLCSFKFLLI